MHKNSNKISKREYDRLADVVLALLVGVTALIQVYGLWFVESPYGEVEKIVITVIQGLIVAASLVVSVREFGYFEESLSA